MMIEGDYPSAFDVEGMRKDLTLILAAAEEAGVATELAQALLRIAHRQERGHGAEDMAAVREPPLIRKAATPLPRRPVHARISSSSSGAGPSTGTDGAIALMGSTLTTRSVAPHAWRHARSWAEETAYTIRPRPIHPWAAEHMGQCSPEV